MPALEQGIPFVSCANNFWGWLSAGAQSNKLAEVGLDNGETVKARLVVGADGARSRTRQLAGELLMRQQGAHV